MITAQRYQDIDAGHRVVGQGGHCELIHGHSYRIHFTCATPELNRVGMVIDFGVMKTKLCDWLLANWDHKFLAWKDDEFMQMLQGFVESRKQQPETGYSLWQTNQHETLEKSIVWVPFNPTAENMAKYLLTTVGPRVLEETNVTLVSVTVDETRKCSATASLNCVAHEPLTKTERGGGIDLIEPAGEWARRR